MTTLNVNQYGQTNILDFFLCFSYTQNIFLDHLSVLKFLLIWTG